MPRPGEALEFELELGEDQNVVEGTVVVGEGTEGLTPATVGAGPADRLAARKPVGESDRIAARASAGGPRRQYASIYQP